MDRHDYKQVLGKIEQQRIARIVDYLQSLPYFKSWTRHAIAKLHYFFTRKAYKRGSLLFSEGDKADHVFLIIEGEFEAYTVMTRTERKDFDIEKLIEHSQEQKARVLKSAIESQRGFHSRVVLQQACIERKTQKIRISQMLDGQMVGEEDIVRSEEITPTRRYTVACATMNGAVLMMRRTDFLKRLKQSD